MLMCNYYVYVNIMVIVVQELRKLPYSAIQLTEIYEFAKLLGGEPCIVPFQAVKLFYAKEVRTEDTQHHFNIILTSF